MANWVRFSEPLMRIAILADDRAVRCGLRQILEEAGVLVVYDGPVSGQGARKAARAGPGLVILDVEAPVANRARSAGCWA